MRPRKICILFLAHDGVANPRTWEAWRRGLEHRITFQVLRNEVVRYPSDFGDRYDTGLRLPTGWGKASTVVAAIRAMRYCIRTDPGVAIVYMVCGHTIPIQRAAMMFRTWSVVSGETFRPFQSIVQHFYDGPSVNQATNMSSTFFALTRSHIEMAYRHLEEIRRRCLEVERNGIDSQHPEEWWLLPFARRHRLAHLDFPMMDRCVETWNSPHPILWTSPSEPRTFMWDSSSRVTCTLHEYIEVCRRHGHLFFRKV